MSDAGDSKRFGSRSSRRPSRLKRIPFLSRSSSPPYSSFNPSDILPQDGHEPYPNRPNSDLAHSQQQNGQPAFGAPPGAQASGDRSVSPPSVFDAAEDRQEHDTEPTTVPDQDEPASYDLKPPPPSVSHSNIEALGTRFFSIDHLDLILRDPNAGARFTQFLETYKPQYSQVLSQYRESKKAITAIDYANAVADQFPAPEGEPPFIAATLDEDFEAKAKHSGDELVEEALPAFLTHSLVTLVTDTLVKEIMGKNAPIMKEMVPALAEVYCLTDPSLPDNPIVYASEEFYNLSQYGREYVIGRNCRFLQGPKTSNSTVRRIVEALAAGEETCETVVNYRRDGTPFMNLLLIAPLYDNKGSVRYFLGCQIDVSPLIDGGKGIESFAQLLQKDRSESRFGRNERDPTSLLSELGNLLNESESSTIKHRLGGGSQHSSGKNTPQRRPGTGRRFLSLDDDGQTHQSRALWPDISLGRSGRLPGVYRNYLLVRPYPSLRITFTSPALRIPGLLQTKLMDRIGGPEKIHNGIIDALSNDTAITAKINWLPAPASKSDRQYLNNSQGKARWIHCTPLLGSDEKVGVWMVVMVEDEEITGQLNRQDSAKSTSLAGPIKLGAVGEHEDDSKSSNLYADYLKDSRPNTTHGSQRTTNSARERKAVDDQFRDF